MGSGDKKDYRSPGEILRESRRKRELSVEDVAEATKISPRMLAALEGDEYEELASPLYARSFLRTLARYYSLDEVMLFERLESFDPEATRPQPPVNLESSEAKPTPSIPVPATAVPEPEAPVTWRVETVDSTQVKHIRPVGGGVSRRALWITLVVVVVAVAAWFLWRASTGGGESTDSRHPSAAEFASPSEDLTPAEASPNLSGDAQELAGSTGGASDPESSRDPAEELTPTTQPADAGSGGEQEQAPPLSPSIPKPRPAESQDQTARTSVQDTTNAVEAQETADEIASESEGEPEPVPQDAAPTEEREDASGGDGLASIVRPGMQPPVAGETILEIQALRRAELWVSADGEGRQRRTLAPGEVLRITARDHFSLELSDPEAVEIRVDGELREVPLGLDSEWVIYPR